MCYFIHQNKSRTKYCDYKLVKFPSHLNHNQPLSSGQTERFESMITKDPYTILNLGRVRD